MPELTNSQRRLYKATYVPLKLSSDNVAPAAAQVQKDAAPDRAVMIQRQQFGRAAPTFRVMDKLSFLRFLRIRESELQALAETDWGRRKLVVQGTGPLPEGGGVEIRLVDLVRTLTSDASPATMFQYAPSLAQVRIDEIVAIGGEISKMRHRLASDVRATVEQLQKAFLAAQNQMNVAPPSDQPPAVPQTAGTAQKRPGGLESLAVAMAKRVRTLQAEAALRTAQPFVVPGLSDLLEWGQRSDLPQARELVRLGGLHGGSDLQRGLRSWISGLPDQAQCTDDMVNGFKQYSTVEPVGRLHLERIEMTPVGIEHGELVHSIPLTPKETVNISHREWSVRAEEFDQIVQDTLEGYSEQGVVDKSELSKATESQSKHDSQFDVNGSVNTHYDGGSFQVTASAAVDYKTQTTDQQAQKDSIQHVVELTRKAGSRTKRDHKTSFKVSSVAGTEEMAVRTLTNPSETEAMRVDYFQLLRKWRVDLIRYGLRMTYDIVIPNPGGGLIGKVLELAQVNKQLSTDEPFSLNLADVIPDQWQAQATTYGAAVDPPPEEIRYDHYHHEFVKYDKDTGFEVFEVDVDDKYVINTAAVYFLSDSGDQASVQSVVSGNIANSGQGVAYFDEHNGKSGRIAFPYAVYNMKNDNGSVELGLIYTLKDSARRDWQVKAWTAMKEAWDSDQTKQRQLLRDRRDKLAEEINQFDALTLRIMEREEIMKGVLRWILGPEFVDQFGLGPLYPNSSDPTGPTQVEAQPDLCKDGWARVMEYGQFIKFIQSAIEWENMLFLPYPYFWDTPKNHDFKTFLWHPDQLHRAFLRAGAARVVLTIRPGFEKDFSLLVDTGVFQTLGDHPYVSIGTEIQNFAKTNYPGIPPANPDRNVRPLLFPEQQKTWDGIQKLARLLDAYQWIKGRYPSTAEWQNDPHPLADFVPLGELITDQNGQHVIQGTIVDEKGQPVVGVLPPLTDLWGNAYTYACPGLHGDYDLASLGSDGKPNDQDTQLEDLEMKADITNWAEGSLVASWYEYTPTSALDVAINMVLQTKPQPA